MSDLHKQHSELWARSKAILDTAEREGRDLTRAETQRFDSISDELDRVKAKIDSTPNPTKAAGRQGSYDYGDTRDYTVSETTTVLDREQRMSAWAEQHRKDDREYPGLTMGGYLRSILSGARTDVERRALGETTDSLGGFLTPEVLSAAFIDRLRAKVVCYQAGARTMPLESDINYLARITGDPVAAWRNENVAITPTDSVFDRITLKPKSLASLVVASRELVDDASNAGAILEHQLQQAIAVELDRAILQGSGVAPIPQGISGTAGVNSVSMGVNGAAFTDYVPILSAFQAILDQNAPDPTAAVMAPRSLVELAKQKDTTGQPLRRPPALDGVQFYATSAMPTNETQGTASTASTLILGDFSQVIVGLRNELRIQVLTERYAEFLQFGFVAYIRSDIAITHPAGMAKVVGIL